MRHGQECVGEAYPAIVIVQAQYVGPIFMQRIEFLEQWLPK
jgi:hypothetical protein